jgi:ribonuclease HI
MSEKRIGEVLVDVLAKYELTPVFRLWFDGACEPTNPGGVATCGWIIKAPDDAIVASGKREVGRGPAATNNVAEYHALGLALRYMLDNHETFAGAAIRIHGDSKLVIEQINGTWNCNAPHLQKLRDRCLAILSELGPSAWEATWIPREKNAEADALSQQAYEDATGLAFPRRRA